jgi:hypothetical protein
MIGARKGAGRATGIRNNSCTPVAANVNEGLDLPFPRSRNQNWRTGFIVSKELPGLLNLLNMTHDDRELTKQHLLFLSQTLGIGVIGHRVVQYLRL